MDIWQTLLYLFIGLIGGAVAGFFISRWYFQRELKKKPPINDKMIRAMFLSMGRKPSEAQVRAVINQMNANR